MARAGGISNPVNVGIAVQDDWEDREFISNISLNVRRLFEFLLQFANSLWKDVEVIDEDCPKQYSGSMDCSVFVLRYMYHIITETPMNFTQDDISKDRIVLVMKLLTHPNNTKQRVMK